MVLGKEGEALQVVHAGFRLGEGRAVDVGGVEHGLAFQSFLPEQDGEGIQFFAGAAAGHPDLERGIGPEVGNDLFADGAEIGRVAEHVAHLHGQVIEKLRKHRPVVEQPLLERGEGRAAHPLAGEQQPALERRLGVSAKVVVILRIHRIQE